ncbi:MAG: hypothetical protein EZS28_023885 [Streblomastix strix]|uniref:Uncharacterized protein n=1 Tax=Streblomastix strix TaxID=222440 RepID=A0A5J4VDG4_9EUKA|nr:MAG: hypothetical protein EZS28_023885 [Streblomastix strix]
MNLQLRRKEEGHLSEVNPQVQILLLSQTRTRVKTSSADSQVRDPIWFQINEIQKGTKEDIHIQEIFPRILTEVALQPQTNTGMGGWGNNSLSGDVEISKGSVIHTKGFFLLFKSEDSEKRLQEKLRICPLSGIKEEEIAQPEKLEEEPQMEENSGCELTEQIDVNDSFQDEWNGSRQRFDKKRRMDNKSRSKISLSSSCYISTAQTVPNIRSNGESLLLQGNADWNIALRIHLRAGTNSGSNEDTKRVRHKNTELHKRSTSPTLEQRKIAKINFDNNENFRSIWMDNSLGEMRNRTKTIDQLPQEDLGLGKDVHKDDRPKKTGTTLLIKEIYQTLFVAGSDNVELSDDFRSESSRSSNGIRRISEGLESDSGTTNRGYFNPTWRMEHRIEERDKQQEGDGSHILRAILLWINLQRAADQSDPHQVRHLYRSVRFSKTKSKLNSSCRSEENSQARTTFENTNSDSTYSRNLKQDNRCISRLSTHGDYQIKKEIFIALCQAWEITPTLDLFATGENKLVDRFVAIGEKEEEAEWLNGFLRPWKEEIFWIHPPIPKIGKALIAWEKFNSKSIMIAPWWPGQIWITHLLTDSSRFLILVESSMILNQGKEMTKREDMLPSGKIAAFLITRKTKPSLAKHHASILNTMFSLIFGIVQISTTTQELTTHAISNHSINNPRYGSTWDINQLYEHWSERPESNINSNEELQVKLASLLMSLCFVKMKEMANIDLSVSIIVDEEHTAAVCIPPKQSNRRKICNVRRTEDLKVGPTVTFYNWKQADQKYISSRLERLVQILGEQNATANSIRYASSTELAAQGFDGRTINVSTHHTPDSKKNKEFYIFAVNRELDSVASALVRNHGMKQATQFISKQSCGAKVSEGDGLQQSPSGNDLQLSQQETLASPLSLPIISIQPIVEAESPNDHGSAKVQNSQMQEDVQDVEPQDEAQDSSMTKGSDRATIAEAQK